MAEVAWTPNHTELCDLLAELILDKDTAKRIATEAGMQVSYVSFKDRAADNWFEIIKGAKTQGLLFQLIDRVLHENERNEKLIEIYNKLQIIEKEEQTLRQLKAGNPYRGLEFFEEAHSEYFFGRDKEIDDLSQLVQEKNLLAVTGPSGCGKSSLLQAGLIPKLKQQARWKYVRFTPSKIPLDNLIIALKSASTNSLYDLSEAREKLVKEPKNISFILQDLGLGSTTENFLLLSDQFEELFTYRDDIDPKDQEIFLDALIFATKVQGVKVVISFRNDFYSFVKGITKFGPIISEIIDIYPLEKEGLRQAIEQPAMKTGVVFQKGLVNTLLEETLDQPGSLPFLEYTLAELWDNQSDGMLTLDAYQKIGRVAGAVSKKAEDQYGSYKTSEEKNAFDKIIIRLIRPGDQTDNTRLIANREDIVSDGKKLGVDTWEMVTKLADARLLVINTNELTNQTTVEVAHEALIRSWDHLDGLVKADREFLTWRQWSFRTDLDQWLEGDRKTERLLRGGDLKLAQDWLSKRALDLGETERDFIFHSLLHSEECLENWMQYFQPIEDAFRFLDSYLENKDPKERRLAIQALRWLPDQDQENEILKRLKGCLMDDSDSMVRSQAAIAIAERKHTEELARLLTVNVDKTQMEHIREAISKARNTPHIGKSVWDALSKKEQKSLRLPSVLGLVLDYRYELAVAIVLPYFVGSFFSLLTSPIWSWFNSIINKFNRYFEVSSYYRVYIGLGTFDIILAFALLLYFYLRRVRIEQQSIKRRDLWFIVGVSAGIGFLVSLLENSVYWIDAIQTSDNISSSMGGILSYLGTELTSLVILYTLVFHLDLEKMEEFNARKAIRLSLICVGIIIPIGIFFGLLGLTIQLESITQYITVGNLVFVAIFGSTLVFSLSILRTFLFILLSLLGYWIGLRYSFPEMTGQVVPTISPQMTGQVVPTISPQQIRLLFLVLGIAYFFTLLLSFYLTFNPFQFEGWR